MNAWGTNGNAMGEDGMQITMNLQYAAGHTGSLLAPERSLGRSAAL